MYINDRKLKFVKYFKYTVLAINNIQYPIKNAIVEINAYSNKIIDITSNNSDEIAVDTSRSFEVVLITSSKEKKTISTEEIRIQNRAGRGTNVMVISLDDEITEVKFS